jgi:acetyl-CoA/propionyl-CoA carboxylase biotin carboxyl carrier protein
MLRALAEYVVEGVPTLVGFHRALLETPEFAAGETCRDLVESAAIAERAAALTPDPALAGEAVAAPPAEPPWAELARRRRERVRGGSAGGEGIVASPIQGRVLSVAVAEGDTVEAGQLLCVVEAMKMENEVHAPRAGTVTELAAVPGAQLRAGERICVVTS